MNVTFKATPFQTLLLGALAGLSFIAIDTVLASTERRETGSVAANLYADGERLMQQGKYDQAADSFRSAIANRRDNTDYPLALGEALSNAGQLGEAGSTLTDLLKSAPMAGAPNLQMARVLAKQGQVEEAAFYYHRAIYGQWKQADAVSSRYNARFELAEFLAQHNWKTELLAELLPLQQQAPADTATQEKLAKLYMTAGSPARAATIFGEQERLHPRDPDLRDGVGESELGRGNFTLARDSFSAALRLRPDDPQARKGLDLTESILGLDPQQKELTAQQQFDRSIAVLQRVVDQIPTCQTPADLTDAAQTALKAHQSVEANLDLAGKLWRAQRQTCTAPIAETDKPLDLLLAKTAQ